MSTLHEFTETLQTLYDQKGSGRLSVLFQFDDSSRACTILVNKGQIADIKPMMDPGRFHSSNVQIKRVMLTASEDGQYKFNPKAPGIADVLTRLKLGTNVEEPGKGDSERVNSKKEKNKSTSGIIALLNEVNEVLAPLVGEGSAAQVGRIAARVSPAKRPVEFLNECRSLIEISLNRKIANEIFKPFYNRVRGTV